MSVLEMNSICKSFSGVKVLKSISLELHKGEIRGLAGENGAGKSTLMKVLSGAHLADSGDIQISGLPVVAPTPEKMIESGIAIIYQELAQAEHLTVAENISMGAMPKKSFGRIDWDKANDLAREVIGKLGFDIEPDAIIGNLSVAKRQMVEIAKAISRNAKVIVLDEPSAVLGDSELQSLFEIIRKLSRENSVSFIYITHRLKEFFDICDSVSVMRDGEMISTRKMASISSDEIINLMVGREVKDLFPTRNRNIRETVLSIKGLSRKGAIEDINFDVRRGEIFGICGLAGSGRSEILHAIVGADIKDSGTITLNGEVFSPLSPESALKSGVGLLPEDRKTQGAFLIQSVAFNISIGCHKGLKEKFWTSPAKIVENALPFIKQMKIKTSTPELAITSLSGGNQQKCLLARQVNAGCNVFLIDEPTRGVDVGAKREIYEVLYSLADRQGATLIIVSSDLLEIMGLCDRIAVMREGKMNGILEAHEATEENIMRLATFH